jgi:peptide/nickel transport system substrate-binding protein
MKWLRRSVAGVATIALLAGLTLAGTALAQTSQSPSTTSGNGSTFIYGDTSEPSSINPMVGYLGTDYVLWAMSYDIPINFSPKDFSPDLQHSIVTAVDTSADSMTFTYTMRSGMKWSDGQPFTANDVAWTLNYYKQHNISNYASDLALVKDVTVVDDTHFEIHSTQPTSIYGGATVFLYDYILPEHIWSKLDQPKKFSNVPAVGSGPYTIESYQQGQAVTLKRNPYYWGLDAGLTPHYDTIIYQNYNDENQEAAALQKGELDLGYFDSANILNTLKGTPGIETHGATVPSFDELGFNTGSAFQTNPAGGFKPHGDGSHAAADPAFRRAIRMAVNSQTIVDKVLLGYGTPAVSPVQPDATTGSWDPPNDSLNFNLDNARKALSDAGYTDTDGNGIVNDPTTGKDVVLNYYIRSSDQNTVNTAPYVKSWLKQIGVGVTITAVSSGKLSSIIEAGTYDLFAWGWYPNPDPNYILGVFTCEERAPRPGVYGNNDSYYCNPAYDQLYQKQLTATDPQERIDTVHKMQETLWQDQPYIMLYNSQVLEAWGSDRVTGFTSQPQPGGDVLATYGPFSFISIHPVTAGSETASSGSSATIWLIAVVVALLLIGGWIMFSRRRNDEDEA